jgi:putative ABC transport system substrate-binding protein
MLLAVLLVAGMPSRGVMAQGPSGVPRVGVLAAGSPEQSRQFQSVDNFRAGMRELGWIEGGNVVIEVRYANGDLALYSANAAALVAEKVDVIVAFAFAELARRATATIPIVMDTTNAIGSGLVTNLARPEGNVTGISNMYEQVTAKQLELLKEIAPRVGKIGFLAPRDYAQQVMKVFLESAAASMGVSLLLVGVDNAVEDLPRRFDEMTAAGADGYLAWADPRTDAMRDAIAALALRHRLPGVAQMRRYADAGVLLSYGASLSAIHRRQAYFVDKILKGAKPADLPIEQPTKIELVVNLKTAKALGLTIPQSILLRADDVVE